MRSMNPNRLNSLWSCLLLIGLFAALPTRLRRLTPSSRSRPGTSTAATPG